MDTNNLESLAGCQEMEIWNAFQKYASEDVFYGRGYRYQLKRTFVLQTSLRPPHAIVHRYFHLTADGLLILKEGYAWDGASGPAVNTLSFVKGSGAHDAFYQMMQLGLLDWSFKDRCDKELVKITRKDGMWSIRCKWVYEAVKRFGGRWSKLDKHGVSSAPKSVVFPGV